MGRKQHTEFEDYKPSNTFLAFAARIKAEDKAEEELLARPDSIPDKGIDIVSTKGSLSGEPVTVNGEESGLEGILPDSVKTVNDHSRPESQAVSSPYDEPASTGDIPGDLTPLSTEKKHGALPPVDELIGPQPLTNADTPTPFLVEKGVDKPDIDPIQRSTARHMSSHVFESGKKSPAVAAQKSGNTNKSLSDFTDLLLNLPVPSLGKNGYEPGEMRVRLSPNTASVLHLLTNYLTDVWSVKGTGPMPFRPDDLANYLFREFLREHIDELRALRMINAQTS